MISLSLGSHSFSLNEKEARYLAESLLTAAVGKRTAPQAFKSALHGQLSVSTSGNRLPVEGHYRSNPDRSDHVLTDC